MSNELFKDFLVGPAEVYVDNVLLGEAGEDGTLKLSQETFGTTLAKTGKNERRLFVIKDSFSFEGSISEVTLSQLAALTGNEYLEGDVSSAVRLKSKIGTELSRKKVIIKPIVGSEATDDEEYWIYMPASTITANTDVVFGAEKQKNFSFVIEAHPVTAEEIASGGRLAADTIAWEDGDFGQIGVEADA